MLLPDYPDDADGDALRSIAANGSDMTRPMIITFAIDAGSEAAAEACRTAFEQAGFEASTDQDEESRRWAVYCPVAMVPEYAGIIRTQKILGELAAEHGGTSDGWATFGNAQARE